MLSGTRPTPTPPPVPPAGAPDRGRRRGITLHTLVLTEVVLAIGLIGWAASGSRLGWIALVVAAVASLALVPWRGRPSAIGAALRRLGFVWARARRRSADLAPTPFDIPTGPAQPGQSPIRTSATGGDTIGARWVGDTLITVLRVAPAAPAVTYLTPGSAAVTDPAGQVVPLGALAECINPFDIPLASIEVISHGVRSWGGGPLAQTYHRTLGPLPATAHRSVLVVLRLNPLDCADAVARRGGGAVGALRTATITTRRVAKRLSESGLRVAVLNGPEITALTDQLTEGSPLDDMTEDWDSITSGQLRFRSAGIEPGAIASVLTTAWVNTALSTTATIRLRHDADGVLEVRGMIRHAELPSAGRTADPLPEGLTAVDGHQFDALAAGLPIALAGRLDRRLGAVRGPEAQRLLDELRLPASGCGQLVGADHVGRAVAVPLLGPDVRAVAISAGPQMVAQVILRAVAIGASVTIHTVRPDQWHQLIEKVGDPRRLALSSDRAQAPSGHRVVVFDGLTGPPAEPHTTHITVLAPGDPRVSELVPDASVIVRQNPRAPQDISVTTATERVAVTMVATPDEWTFIGR
ncbi:type VII secretion protein EccE [Gordonia insulae]|uniref:ESX-1 secretion system protein EccE1 n=1 Tax=Gordonia insulae TaxID=2420509 RepID=A0A3G8JW01_9ACTN|nr:type VII secretion protein EccE [Gordonia insulae]AZG48772.1 ESX-1 secretion system protein EccE1 [Gordonia insulae]